MSKGHLSQPINIHRGNLNLNTFTHSSWNFFCLCHCLCHCNCLCHCIWNHCMIEYIVLFTSIFHFRGLAGSLDDSKGFGSDLDFSCGLTDRLTNGRTEVFQEVLADLKIMGKISTKIFVYLHVGHPEILLSKPYLCVCVFIYLYLYIRYSWILFWSPRSITFSKIWHMLCLCLSSTKTVFVYLCIWVFVFG